MPELDLSKPQRQSPVGVGVIFFQKLRVAVNIFISIAVVQFGFKANLDSGLFIALVGGVVLVVFVIAYLIYRKFHFYVEEDKFVIERGLLRRDKISVAFDRIQSVHINQNLIQRILSVVGLKIDTAGSAVKELEISALPKKYARSLQEYLTEKRDKNKLEEGEYLETKENESLTTNLQNSDRIPLVKLSPLDLLKIGLTENHLRTGFILFAIVMGYVFQYEEYLLKPFEPYLERNADFLLAEWVILLPIGILFFLLVSVVLSLIQSLLKYFNLNFFVDQKGVQLVSGLIKKAEFQIPINKIQYLKWTSNPLRKMIGLKTIIVKQAGSNESGDRQSLTVPGSTDAQITTVLNEFYPERLESAFKSFGSHPFFRLQVFVVFGIVPAALLLISWAYHPLLIILSPIWLLSSIPFALKYANAMRLECNQEMLKIKRGWVFPKVMVIKYYKLQNLKIHQNLFQKRRNTVHLDFYTAAGNLRMWQLNEKVAKELYNYILFKVESSNASWM